MRMACALGDAIESDYSTRFQRPRLGVRDPGNARAESSAHPTSTGPPAPRHSSLAFSTRFRHGTCYMTASLTLIITLFNHATPDCDSVAHDWKFR